MQSSPAGRASIRWPAWLLLAAVTLLALAPWWRNHRYLRDFYDYGLVMSGVGRIAAGERPYVDFMTPIQTGTFLFNGWAEKLGDGTYQAMTRGAAVLTVLGVGMMAVMLSRRLAGGAAALLAGALAVMTLSQHTIIWHNPVGALCIAVATWGAAVAPVWRRAQWPWHALTAAALVIGGLTKLNAHLVAICGVLAWALLAGFSRRAEWPRVAATMALVLVAGVVAPLIIELAWAQASPAAWWYNVVALPLGSRSGDLEFALHGKFYFTTRHDYYGLLPVPPLGAIGILATAGFTVAAIRQLGWRQGGWVIAAAGFAAASGAGLLATNYEIAYVAMGAWFALIAALWLGFSLRAAGVLFHGTLLAPALVIGAIAWQSAWQGQRSQFGYSRASRADYVAGETVAPDFSYLRGTRLPPETALSMSATAAWRATLPPELRRAVFYGPGLEWLERPWPALKLPGLPLWMHGGTSYGPAEEARLRQALTGWGPYRHVLVPEARNFWGPVLQPVLADKYNLRRYGPVWFHYAKLPPGIVSWRPVEFLHAFGGNVNSTQLVSEMNLQDLPDGRTFIGVTRGAGEMKLIAPSFRAQGEAVLRLLPGQTAPPGATVHFEVFSVAGGNSYPRWSAEVALPAGAAELIVPFPVDCGGSPLRFVVTVPPALAGRVAAGWRALFLLHSADGPETPLMMRAKTDEAVPATAGERAALLPAGWNPPAIYLRDARLGTQGLELLPGGEIWIRLSGMFKEITGVATVADDVPMTTEQAVRVLYAKGAKLDVLTQAVVSNRHRRFGINAWSAEPDGWLIILVDPVPGGSPVTVRLTGVKAAD